MLTPQAVKTQIRDAFATGKHPGDDRIRGSDEGDEPFEVERDFRGKNDWKALSPQFIDGGPNGLASALSFFSDAAFQFYLPAYLIADIDGQLERSNPIFHLIHGLERSSASTRINPQRFGERTWSEYARQRFSGFTREQAAAIAAYLTFNRDAGDILDSTCQEIDDALKRYWNERAS